MNSEDRQKLGKNGPRRHEPPDTWLDRQMHDVYIALKANEGTGAYASRRIANAAHGLTTPHRSIANVIRDAKRAKCQRALAEGIGKVLIEYAKRSA
jgi:hypothetical protein